MADLERPKMKVGFIPIIDCAAIVLAEELGAYERQGLEVEIRREVSWANVRDKLALGVLDASHILAPLPLAHTLGIDSVSVPMINAMTLAGERQRAHPVAKPVAGDGGGGARVRGRAAARRSMRAPSPRSSPGARRAAPSRWCWPRSFPTRRRTTCCGCGCRRPASIPIATCASPSCRRRIPWPISRAARSTATASASRGTSSPRRWASAASRSPVPTSGRACRRRCWAPPKSWAAATIPRR